MSEFQVTFLEQPEVGRACRMIYNGQVGQTATVTNVGKHPTQANWLRVLTQTGVICQGPVQTAASGSWLARLSISAKVAVGLGAGALVIFGILILMAIVGATSTGSSSRPRQTEQAQAPEGQPRATSDQAPTIWVTARQIHSSHANNTISWDATYLHKRLRLAGIVQNVSKDVADQPYVILESAQGERDDCVQCSFPETAAGQLANLSCGDEVTLDAICDGCTLGTVLVSDSRLVSVLPRRTIVERQAKAQIAEMQKQAAECKRQTEELDKQAEESRREMQKQAEEFDSWCRHNQPPGSP